MDLNNLDFLNENSDEFQINRTDKAVAVSQIPLPDEVPSRQKFAQNIPVDILKTNTVENLISQNEDLMARLKVALRRLSVLELENQKITEESNKIRLSQSAFNDQLMVFKEKDNAWKKRVDQAEKDREVYAEKFYVINEKMQKLNIELERYRKYQDRIKQQVKPYVSQLKEISKNLENKNIELTTELERKEADLRDLRHQIIELTKNSRTQIEILHNKNIELTEYYESQLEKLTSENKNLKENQVELENKAVRLHRALERQDELENELVEVSRSKDDLRNRLDKEIHRLQERNNELTRHNQKLGIEHADLQVKVVDDQNRIYNLERENVQLNEQVESLRYMWTAKNEENEKIKSAMASLEKLNLELSQKINDIRRSDNI